MPTAGDTAAAPDRDDLEPAAKRSFVPCVRLLAEPVLIGDGDEERLPLIALSFDYGGTRVRAADSCERVFRSDGNGMQTIDRDAAGEAQARRLLERLGAVELACCEELSPMPGSDVDYVVRPGADHHAL